MVRRRHTHRRGTPPRQDPKFLFLWVIPGISVLFIVMFFASQNWKETTPERAKSKPQVWTPAIKVDDTKEDEAFEMAKGALSAIEGIVKDLDRQARRFERDRTRGTYGDDRQNLLKSWDRWSEIFHRRIREAGEEFDIKVDELDRDTPTPVHNVYRLVMRVPFEIRRNWEDGKGIEGIPVRAGVDELLAQAHTWIEKR